MDWNVKRRPVKPDEGTARLKPNLRDLQKAATRQRILEVAKDVFYQEGYYAATIDQIVAAVGASRPTFYLHFADKAQVLAQLVADYNARGCEVMERLPGPLPSLEQLRSWLLEMSAFFEREKASFSVVGEVSAHSATHSTYGMVTTDVKDQMTVDVWLAALARRAPAFALAMTENEYRVEALARGRLLILQVIWAASLAWEQRSTKLSDVTLIVVARAIHEFLHDPRLSRVDAAKKKRQISPRKRAE